MSTDTYRGAKDLKSPALSPSGTNGRGAEPSPEPVECKACGHVSLPVGKGQCSACRCWLPGNSAALVHGRRRFEDTGLLPPDLRDYLDSFEADVVADLGGETELSTIQQGLVSALRGLEASRLLLLDFALRAGTDTKRGRDALAEHGQTVDRWCRLAKVIGLRRRPREVTVSDWVAGRNGQEGAS